MMVKIAPCLLSILLAAPALPGRALAGKSPLSRVKGFSRLGLSQREAARAALEKTPCYHGCKHSFARCLGVKPRVPTAWRVARYAVFLASKGLRADQIQQVLVLRKKSVLPDKVHQLKVDATTPRLGDPRAKVVIVEFADFRCGHCAVVSPALKKVVRSMKGKAVLYFKPYPLRFRGPNLKACWAALAAHRQGKFWPMARLLFANQDAHTQEGVEKLARKLKLDMDKFRAHLKDVNLAKVLEANKIEGLRAGLKGTPTIYVNGKKYRMRKDERHFRDRIEEELELLAAAR